MLLQGIPHEGVHAFAHAYAHAPFAGRTQTIAKFQAFLQQTTPRGLLCAPAGRGKSALMYRWVQGLDAAGFRVVWLPISLRYGTHRSSTLDDLLNARVRWVCEQSGHWRDLLSFYKGPPLLLALDGLDELQDSALLEALSDLELPRSVKLLASARSLLNRDATGWANHLGWTSCVSFDLAPLTLEEIAACLPANPPSTHASELMLRTGGDPLLVRICMETIDSGAPIPDVSDPTELVGAWWADQRARLQAPQGELAERALAALGAACGVVPWSVLASVVGVDETALRSLLQGFERFVSEVEGQGVSFAHPRFAEVARWTFADATQQAHQRFAELALEARRGEQPPDYFLHFALPHLEAAGASDEALETLISAISLAAWQRAEGSAFGMLREIQALRQHNARKLTAAWGTPEQAPLLRQQAYLQTLAATLPTTIKELSPEFLRELVRHGLRSTTQALQIMSELPSDKQSRAQSELLPLLPDSALPALLALFPATEECPSTPLLLRLIRANLLAEAQHYLEKFEDWPTRILLQEAPSFSEEQRAWLRARIDARIPATKSPRALFQHLKRLPLLPREEQEAELELSERLLQKLWETPENWEQDPCDFASAHALVEEAARQGRGELALRWLRRIEEREAIIPGEKEPPISLYLALWRLLSGHERDEAMRLYEDALRRQPPSENYLGYLISSGIPDDFPGRAAIEETFWSNARESHQARTMRMAGSPRSPVWIREQAAQSLFTKADRAFAQLASSPEDNPATIRAWSDVAYDIKRFSLPSPTPLFERLPRWLANPRSPRGALLSAMIRLATTRETREQVRQWLADGAITAGDWLWESESWLEVFSTEERTKILQEQLRQPAKQIELSPLILHAVREMNPNVEREEREALWGEIMRISPQIGLFFLVTEPASQELLQPGEREDLLHQLFASTAMKDPPSRWSWPLGLLRTSEPHPSRYPLVRTLLQGLSGHDLPWFCVEAEVLAHLPPEEARAWVSQNCSQTPELATNLASWCRSTARWRPEELEELFLPGERRAPPPVDSIFGQIESTTHPPSLSQRQTARFLSRIPERLWTEIVRPTPENLSIFRSLVESTDANMLLFIASRLRACSMENKYTESLAERAAMLLLRGSVEAPEQEAQLVSLLQNANSDGVSGKPKTSETVRLLAWLWEHRRLPPGERARQFLKFQASLSVFMQHVAEAAWIAGIHEEVALRLSSQPQGPRNHLDLYARLWKTLSPETQTTLRRDISASVHAVQAQRENDRPRWTELLLSWGMDRLEEADLREAWLNEAACPAPTFLFPLEALRKIGGSEAVKAWACGVTEALRLLPESDA